MTQSLDRALNRWNQLRRELAEASRARAHVEIVRLCDAVLAFAAENPAVAVVEWMFHKRAAKALAALGRLPEAVARIDMALAGCRHYRATVALSKPDDFLDEVAALERVRAVWTKKLGK